MGFAFITLITNEHYIPGALTLYKSLRSTGTHHEIAVMVPENSLSTDSLSLLAMHFDNVLYIPIIRSRDYEQLQLLGRTDLDVTLTKLSVFNPDLVKYDLVCFMDADTLVLQNIDHVFGYMENADFAAAPDIGWPDCFNSGVFCTRPSTKLYKELIKHSQSKVSFDGGDQGLLNSFFSGWSGHSSGSWAASRLPFGFNVTPSASYTYLPAYVHYFNEIRVVHFIGKQKPWMFSRDQNGNIQTGDGSSQYNELLRRWWSVYRSLKLVEYSAPSQPAVLESEQPEPVKTVQKDPRPKKVPVEHKTPLTPHSGYDFSFATTPGLPVPKPPPTPKLTVTGIPLLENPLLPEPIHTELQAPTDFGTYKVDWNSQELIKTPDSATQKLNILNDIELQLRELSIDAEDHSAKKLLIETQSELDEDPTKKRPHLRKWFGIKIKPTDGFSWGLSGATGKHQEILFKPSNSSDVLGSREDFQKSQPSLYASVGGTEVEGLAEVTLNELLQSPPSERKKKLVEDKKPGLLGLSEPTDELFELFAQGKMDDWIQGKNQAESKLADLVRGPHKEDQPAIVFTHETPLEHPEPTIEVKQQPVLSDEAEDERSPMHKSEKSKKKKSVSKSKKTKSGKKKK